MNFNQIKAQASAIAAQAKAKALSVDYKGYANKLKDEFTVAGLVTGSLVTSAAIGLVMDDITVTHPDGSTMEYARMSDALDDVLENPGSLLEIEAFDL